MSPIGQTKNTYRVGDLIDLAKQRLAELGDTRSPLMVEGFVSFNANTARYDHKYFSLCQYSDPNLPVGKPLAKLEAVIFANRFAVISSQLRQISMNFAPDLRAVFLGYLEIYKPTGKLQLVVVGIDIERTKQITEGAKDILRAKLKSEGVFDLNRELKVPLVPLRIALVTSRGSAAESDFITKLATDRYKFRVTRVYVNTSGQNVSFSVPDALAKLNERTAEFDLVVLARGGGDHVDLANFSLEGPVRAVATCKIPVWAAIGHSTDDVLVNEVANRSLSNPNDAASELNAVVSVFERMLAERSQELAAVARRAADIGGARFERTRSVLYSSASHRLADFRAVPADLGWELKMAVKGRLDRHRAEVAEVAGQARSAARIHVMRARYASNSLAVALERSGIHDNLERGLATVVSMRERLSVAAMGVLGLQSSRLHLIQSKIEGLDPGRILASGYAIVLRGGKRIASVAELALGDTVQARLVDGSAEAVITAIAAESAPSDGTEQ